MHLPRSIASSLLALATLATAATPGYFTDTSTLAGNDTFTFGTHYAVLNLDLIEALVSSINTTAAGASFISCTRSWITAVHAQSPPPLSIFTRIYFSNAQRPEIGPQTPFGAVAAGLGNVTESSAAGMLYDAFVPLEGYDVVLQKTRYYAGAGNGLEEILRSQLIDTVILVSSFHCFRFRFTTAVLPLHQLPSPPSSSNTQPTKKKSGIRTSGVILNTAYTLFNLNYNVYVISNNTIETPPSAPGIDKAIKEGILPKLPANVITLEQAIAALGRSGPAVY